MIIILDKRDRTMLGTAETIAEARAIRAGRTDETVCEIVGPLAYHTRHMR